jgi:hypothetical protein
MFTQMFPKENLCPQMFAQMFVAQGSSRIRTGRDAALAMQAEASFRSAIRLRLSDTMLYIGGTRRRRAFLCP